MAERIGSADAKARLGELVARVEYGRERFIIQKRGRPVAALVGMDDLQEIADRRAKEPKRGALALVGLWQSLDDEAIDQFVSDVYESRAKDTGRTVEIEA
jgi:prevent-host-death family protein